jgi:hypothetical protein
LGGHSDFGARVSAAYVTYVSQLSINGGTYCGNALSTFGLTYCESPVSIVDYINLGSMLSVRCLSRIGSVVSSFSRFYKGKYYLSSTDMHICSSAMSLRSISRSGSSISGCGSFRVAPNSNEITSIYSSVIFGSCLSLRNVCQMSSSCSINSRTTNMGCSVSSLNMCMLGSSASLRCSNLVVGKAVSVCLKTRFGALTSYQDTVGLGSSFSVRHLLKYSGDLFSINSNTRMSGCDTSLLSSTSIGSSLSLRNLSSYGSTASASHKVVCSNSISVFDFVRLGSQLSIRTPVCCSCERNTSVHSYVKLAGSALSLLSFSQVGSALSSRQCTRAGHVFP